MFKISKTITITAVAAVALLSGCASNADYNNAFKGDPQLKNSQTFEQSKDVVDRAMAKTLAERGFQVTDSDGRYLRAVNKRKKTPDSERTFLIKTNISTLALGDESTQVNIAAEQKTILRQKKLTWFHLIVIPVIPTGTRHETHITDSGAITKDSFYQDFFQSLEQNINQMNSA